MRVQGRIRSTGMPTTRPRKKKKNQECVTAGIYSLRTCLCEDKRGQIYNETLSNKAAPAFHHLSGRKPFWSFYLLYNLLSYLNYFSMQCLTSICLVQPSFCYSKIYIFDYNELSKNLNSEWYILSFL